MTLPMRACGYCARLIRRDGATTCTAFPDGIPDVINSGQVAHVQPYPGDHGLQWTVDDGAPASIKAANHPFPGRLSAV